jgi:hypothetical protein
MKPYMNYVCSESHIACISDTTPVDSKNLSIFNYLFTYLFYLLMHSFVFIYLVILFIHLFTVVYLTTLSVTRGVELLDEFEMIWNEAVVA